MLKLFIFTLIIGCCLAQNRPFPRAITYKNCIKPAIAQSTLNNDVINFYNYWKGKYLKQSPVNSTRWYILANSTGGSNMAITNSEAHGYGMIITALMAGYDASAKKYFNGLYAMFDSHRSVNNQYLMQWQVKKDEKPTKEGSATDGDMDIAYALLLAHYQWNSTTTNPYLTRATQMINKGLKVSYIMSSLRLALSDDPTSDIYSTRPSDWMFGHMKAYHKHTNDDAWLQLSTNLYSVFKKVVSTYASTTGLISDFVVGSTPRPADPYKPQSDEGPNTGKYYYNAGRVPMRVVMDYAHYGTADAKTVVNKLVNWVKTSTAGSPSKIKAGYDLDGTRIGNYQSSFFISPIIAGAVQDSAHQQFVTDGWNLVKNMKEDYFEDTFNLLCMLFISGNWWIPA